MSTNLSTSTVGTSNLTPDGAGLGTVDGLLGAVDESDTLAEVGTSFGLVGNVFELEDRGGGGLGVLGTTVSHMTSLNKESIYNMKVSKGRYRYSKKYNSNTNYYK